MDKCYTVNKCSQKPLIDADWDKPFWRDVASVSVNVSHWNSVSSEDLPETKVKLQYDDQDLYVIFRVHDRCLRAVTTQIHGEVWKDSCVEFFFAPRNQLLRCPAGPVSYWPAPKQPLFGDYGLSTNTDRQHCIRPDST